MPETAYSCLTPAGLATLRARSIELLVRHGVRMDHAEVVAALSAAGADADAATGMVRFPERLIEEMLKLVPKSLTLWGRDGAHRLDIPHPDGTFHARPGTGAHGFIDPETNAYRKVTRDDAARWARLVDGLDEIGFTPYPFLHDAPTATADIHGLRTMLANTSKHIWIQPYSEESIGDLMRLAAAAAGGEAALAREPLASCITCSFTPLEFKHMDLEAIRQCAGHGVPIHACSLPTAGGTAPITMPGLVVMGVAEILAQLVTAQVLCPGAPAVATLLVFALDMRTGRSLQTSAEAMQGAAMGMQLLKQGFGLPSHAYGSGTDSPTPDGQSMAERALLGHTVVLAGADILGGAGQLEVATAISPVQLVIDNELSGMIRRAVAPPVIDDETLDWDGLMGIEPGGHFLATRHTLRNCRCAYQPTCFTREPRSAWEAAGSADLFERAREVYRTLDSEHQADGPPADRMAEMDGIVAAADRRLAA